MTLRIALVGHGRMGRAVAELAPAAGAEVCAIIDAATPISAQTLGGAAVAIEFTSPGAVAANVRACVDAGCPVVVGTTGWAAELDMVTRYVRERGGAMLWSPNFSLGVHALRKLVELAGRLAGGLAGERSGFDVALVETHHAAKKDAPSGTAIMLADEAARELGRDVPITSIRVGAVPGVHELILDAAFEQIRIVHEARDRRVFAEGALVAARWLAGRRGVFTLDDALSTAPSPSR